MKKRYIKFATFCLLLLILGGRLVQLQLNKPAVIAAAKPVQTRPIVDEDPAEAKLPLSKALDLDFFHDGQAYVKFNDVVRSRLRHKQFADIDAFAAQLRETRQRLPGGGWRLFTLYEQITEPSGGVNVEDADWQTHFHLLEQWIAEVPDSITARVAYADSWIAYAWVARGNRFANEVRPEQWKGFEERLTKADGALQQAWKIQTKCPHLFYVTLSLALSQGWPRERFDKVFDEAVAYEPLYRGNYYKKAEYLLPKWDGEEGEWEKFAVHSADQLGGAEGSTMFYFLFDGVIDNYEDKDQPAILTPAWDRLKKGFVDTDKTYRVMWSIVNTYARWAYFVGDRAEARKAFDRIGAHWNEDIWKSKAEFDKAKAWASIEESPPASHETPPRSLP